ncbi:MAG: ATP-dependent Clp protease proteolytic subunit [Armatimonadota bacterium]|nr:ATP-dependent Clp protease proteolytic subunit [Armatimonadota bacterium]
MFTRIRPGGLSEDRFETATTYLGRERRMLFLRGPIMGVPARWDSFSATAVHDAVMAFNLEDSRSEIYLLIDSEGGSVWAGFALYDCLRASRAPVVTVGQNIASMATVVFAAGRRRLLTPNARVMLHLPWGTVSGDARDAEIRTGELKKIRDMILDAYQAAGVKRSRRQILRDIDREFWMGAEEAVRYGLADGIISADELMFGPRQQGRPEDFYGGT